MWWRSWEWWLIAFAAAAVITACVLLILNPGVLFR